MKINQTLFVKVKTIYSNLTVSGRPFWIAYSLAFSTGLFALFHTASLVIFFWNISPFLIFIPTIIVTSWYGGFLPGLVASILAIFVGDYFFTYPYNTLIIFDPVDLSRLFLFSLIGVIISAMSQSFHNARYKSKVLFEQLRMSENKFKHIANSAPVILWIMDQKGKTTFCNKTMFDFLGIKNVYMDAWKDCIHPDEEESVMSMFEEAYKTKKAFSCEFKIKHVSSNYHWIYLKAVPYGNTRKGFSGFMVTCLDITARKHFEQEKITFLATIAHELRTPLTTLQLIHYSLSGYKLSKEMKNDLDNMQQELVSFDVLVGDLLDFVRYENQMFSLKKEEVEIVSFLRKIVVSFQNNRHISMLSFASSLESQTLYIDSYRIRQVLINLLENAMRASSPQERIVVSVDKKDSYIQIAVEDKGKGISPSQQKHIFDKFYHQSDTYREGFGLGLFIAKHIIEKHQGKIWVESALNAGSTFYFTLPIYEHA